MIGSQVAVLDSFTVMLLLAYFSGRVTLLLLLCIRILPSSLSVPLPPLLLPLLLTSSTSQLAVSYTRNMRTLYGLIVSLQEQKASVQNDLEVVSSQRVLLERYCITCLCAQCM